MKVLVVGGGAREHTLVWKLAQSPKVQEIYVAPGNAGTAQVAHNLNISSTDIESLTKIVQEQDIELVVVGPEVPLADGIVDHFQTIGVPIFGPTKAAARIESSKVFAKELMKKYGIPCARSATFSQYSEAEEYIKRQTLPVVIKADGLAAGKGVIVADSISQALEALVDIMGVKTPGVASKRVVIEEYLSGQEMSFFVFTDSQTVVPMVPACDYKRVYDGDQGPNTGGMGSYSPPYYYTLQLGKMVLETIMKSAIRAMGKEKKPYQGVLYSGLMLTNEGPKALEFNARFGDPEAQVTIPRLETDLVDVMLAAINGNLDRVKVKWSEDTYVGVVMVSAGYPGSYKTGFPITGLDNLDKDILVFHSGTKIDPESGQILTNGGRVLTVVAKGETIIEAREKVYANIPRIHFDGCRYRQDIAEVKGSRWRDGCSGEGPLGTLFSSEEEA
ncbi:phosphoribosylamine--glycine ligase [Chloroflexota bacterium]